MENSEKGSLANQMAKEAEKLKLYYMSSSKEIENWPRADSIVRCSDEQFDVALQSLSPKDLQASVLVLQREIDIVQQQLSCLENQTELTHNREADKALGRQLKIQAQLATLRSRILRCLTKQLRDNGNKSCELPHWTNPVTFAEPSNGIKDKTEQHTVIDKVDGRDKKVDESPEELSCTSNSHIINGTENTAAETEPNSATKDQFENGVHETLPEDTDESQNIDKLEKDNVIPVESPVKSRKEEKTSSMEAVQIHYSEKTEISSSAITSMPEQTESNLQEKTCKWEEPSTRTTAHPQFQYDPNCQANLKVDDIGNALEKTKCSLDKPAKTEESARHDGNIKETVNLDEMAVVLKKAAAENRKSYQEWKLKRAQSEEKPEGDESGSAGSLPPSKPSPYRGNSLRKMEEEKKATQEIEKKMEEMGVDAPDAVVITEKPNVQNWDPSPLLKDILGELKPIGSIKTATPFSTAGNVRMAGYMDKLPSSYKQKKSSIFKGWKRRHFKALSGRLYYYEDHRCPDPLGIMELKDCSVSMNGKVLEILEKDGIAGLKVRCASALEAEDWKSAIEAEIANWNSDSEGSNLADSVVIIDIGSSSVKAGFAHEEAWPQVIFPCVCAVLKEDESDRVYGFQALEPQRRKNSKLFFPLRRTFKIDKLKFDPADLIGVLEHAFLLLKIDPAKHKVIMTIPQNTGIKEKEALVEILLGYFRVEAIYLQEQAILAMYSYSAVSGIVVDIGDHIDVIPVVEGCIIESGATRLPYGGRQVTDTLARHLTEKGHRFFSEVETYIVRLIKEQACYVLEERIDDDTTPIHSADVNLAKYGLPDGTTKVTVDTARYRCTEGLFEPRHWGKDHLGVHELTYKAIQSCAIDMRRQMCRNIYLSGGGSMIPGFAERLQMEVSALLPQSSHAQVHAGTDRHHAAFIGASVVARLPIFDQLSISQEEWDQMGPEALEKWQNL